MEVKLETAPGATAEAPPGAEVERCRCCFAAVSGGCIRLKELCGSEESEAYWDVLRETFNIKLSNMECDRACEACAGRLRDARDFRRLVLETERRFLQLRPGGSKLAATISLEVKLEAPDAEPLDIDETAWDADYLDTEDYIDVPLSPKVEVKVKKEKKPAQIAGVFTPVGKKVEDLLRQKAGPSRQDVLRSFAKMLGSKTDKTRKPLNESLNRNTVRALAGKPLSTTRSLGVISRPAGTLASKSRTVTGKLLSISKSCELASKLLNAKDLRKAKLLNSKVNLRKGQANGRTAKLNVDSLLKAIKYRPVTIKIEPSGRDNLRGGMERASQREVVGSAMCDKRMERQIVKQNVILLLRNTTICPFISFRSNYRCLYCGTTFFNFDDLRAHTVTDHDDLAKAVRKVHSFKDIIHVDITSLKCRLCDVEHPDVETIKEHLIKEHRIKINMKHRDDVVPFKLTGTEYKCHICSEEFHVFRNLSLHMNIHFPNYMCEVCGKSFISARRCASHEDTHKKGTFACSKCNKVFDSMNSRSAHTLEHRETKYRCPQCPERFEKYLQRTLHMSEVHGITRTFRCTQPGCDKEFIHKPQMAAHVRTHSRKDKKVVCAECGMRFYNNYALKKHMVSHTGERPFQCKVCGKKYGRKNTLREHMRIHENDRRHVCMQCGQGFVQKCSLNGHMKSRHPHAVPF